MLLNLFTLRSALSAQTRSKILVVVRQSFPVTNRAVDLFRRIATCRPIRIIVVPFRQKRIIIPRATCVIARTLCQRCFRFVLILAKLGHCRSECGKIIGIIRTAYRYHINKPAQKSSSVEIQGPAVYVTPQTLRVCESGEKKTNNKKSFFHKRYLHAHPSVLSRTFLMRKTTECDAGDAHIYKDKVPPGLAYG